MRNRGWRREARVLEEAYDLEADDEQWALRVLTELSRASDTVTAATAHAVRGGTTRLVASVGATALIAELPHAILLPVDEESSFIFALALRREATAAVRLLLQRLVPHLRTAASLRESGRGAAAGATLLKLEGGIPPRAAGLHAANAAWHDLLTGRLSRIAMRRDGRTTQVFAVRNRHAADPRALTARELSIAARCALGEANKSMAIDLGVSPVTVSNELTSAMEKLGLRSRAELVGWFGERTQPIARAS
jgi:DNA-binding NarL/FixJ family response regulator